MLKLKLDEIEIAALCLPEWDRLHLAELLLASLDNDENVRDAWVAEAERRAEDKELRNAAVGGDDGKHSNHCADRATRG